MGRFAIAILLLICVNYARGANCAATSYCQGCDTSNGQCDVCSGLATFTGGARYLSSGACAVMTSTPWPTVGSGNLAWTVGTTRATASYTGSNYFFCNSGYYAYIDETDTSLTGCYATSTLSSAPLSNISGTPTTTNGTY